MALPREYISHNQIRMYADCPQKYHYCYVKNLPLRLNERILLGMAFHATLEEYFQGKIRNEPLDEPTTIAAYHRCFQQIQQEKEVEWSSPPADSAARGLAFVKFFFHQVAPEISPLMVEKELTVDIPAMGVKLKGIIDLVEMIDGAFCITDFKTTTSKWSGSKAQKSLQLLIYKYLFDHTFGNIDARLKLEIIYSKSDHHIRRQTVNITPKAEDIEQMLQVLDHVVHNIRDGVFPPRPSYLCKYCEYMHLCRQKGICV